MEGQAEKDGPAQATQKILNIMAEFLDGEVSLLLYKESLSVEQSCRVLLSLPLA